jgi:hypothetical protein
MLLLPLFACSSPDSSASSASVASSTDLPGAVTLFNWFEQVSVGAQLVSAFRGQCGNYLWIEVNGCIAKTIYTWNHNNMAELACRDSCLVSLTINNGTSVGYSAPSTCARFAASVSGQKWLRNVSEWFAAFCSIPEHPFCRPHPPSMFRPRSPATRTSCLGCRSPLRRLTGCPLCHPCHRQRHSVSHMWVGGKKAG